MPMAEWPPNLDYVDGLARDVSERSVFGSLSISLARQTRDVVAELRVARVRLAQIQRILDTSKYGPTGAEARATLYAIRQAMTHDGQETSHV